MNELFPWRIAYITAGAGGMYCGSCLHDNTLARTLARQGVDIQLIPTYTPLRTDEENVSLDRVFFGGINVYLQQKVPFFRFLPSWMDRLLDRPWLIRLATSRGMETSARDLGALTVSMLQGKSGFQRKEVRKLCDYLAHQKPHLVHFTNILIGGCIPAVKERLDVPVLVTLQGDDVFLDELIDPFKSQAFEQIRRLVADVDGFLVYSRYYAEFMRDYFSIPPEKIHIVPLGLDTADFEKLLAEQAVTSRPPTVGYLARLAPEKGLHNIVDAFLELRKKRGTENAVLRVAGWMGPQFQAYATQQFDRLRAAGLRENEDFVYVGEVSREGKIAFLQSIDVLSVPTTYRDPKGLFVLEALAAGVPVVQPAHGAFPELIEALGGGLLARPDDRDHLSEQLHTLLIDGERRREVGRAAQALVHQQRNAQEMSRQTLACFTQFVREAAERDRNL